MGSRILKGAFAGLLLALLAGPLRAATGFRLRAPDFPVLALRPGQTEMDLSYSFGRFLTTTDAPEDTRNLDNAVNAHFHYQLDRYFTLGAGVGFEYLWAREEIKDLPGAFKASNSGVVDFQGKQVTLAASAAFNPLGAYKRIRLPLFVQYSFMPLTGNLLMRGDYFSDTPDNLQRNAAFDGYDQVWQAGAAFQSEWGDLFSVVLHISRTQYLSSKTTMNRATRDLSAPYSDGVHYSDLPPVTFPSDDGAIASGIDVLYKPFGLSASLLVDQLSAVGKKSSGLTFTLKTSRRW